MPRSTAPFDPREPLQTQGPASLSLDSALEYIRSRGARLTPLYVLAMAPMAVIVLFLIDAVSAQHRSVIASLCIALLPATVWRWAWLGRMQQIVQQDLQARSGLKLRTRLIWIIVTRLYANVVMTWGGLVILPSFYGLFAGGFAAPLLLEREGGVVTELIQVSRWIHHSGGRLFRVTVAMTFIAAALLIGTFVVQWTLLQFLLPSLLDVDSASLTLTFESLAWRLTTIFMVMLLVDFFWAVASVFLYYDSQSRRTGSDLRARFSSLPALGGPP